MIRREPIPGTSGTLITMPDGTVFTTFQPDETDAELEAFAAQLRDFEDGPYFDPDEDPDTDGYGWERRALAELGV